MGASKKERRDLGKKLKEARAKRVLLLKKLEKARAKFERRGHKLQALEDKIADLSRQVFGPDMPASEPVTTDDSTQPHDEMPQTEAQPVQRKESDSLDLLQKSISGHF